MEETSQIPYERQTFLTNIMPVFSCKRDIPQISKTSTDKPFTIKISIIRKRLAMIGKGKLVGTDCIPGEILKMGG
jgi:hypothetical protein